MDRPRRILDAAAEAFYEKGFHGVGMDELGTRAGLSGPSLYRHFSGKDEILATLLNEAMDELLAATVRMHGDPSDDLDRALAHHVSYALSHRHLVTVYQREVGSMVDPWRSSFKKRRARYAARWQRLFRECFPGLDPATASTASQACLGMIFSVAAWPGRTARADHVSEVLDLLVHKGITALDQVSPASP